MKLNTADTVVRLVRSTDATSLQANACCWVMCVYGANVAVILSLKSRSNLCVKLVLKLTQLPNGNCKFLYGQLPHAKQSTIWIGNVARKRT